MSARSLLLGMVAIVLLTGCERAAAPPPQAVLQRDGQRSMKGWEAYVWTEGENTRFSLLIGTNRNKTASEIFDSAPAEAAESDLTIVRAAPMSDVREALSRLASGESAFVTGVRRLEVEQFETVPLADDVLQSLRAVSSELNLKMN